ncbi:MAG: response regulator, partial [Bdellovibrionales bacterium]|nr:response regulator [Bdellovibrionales bacterium]
NQQRLFAAIAGTLFSLIALGGIFVTPFTEMINGVPITEGFDLRIVLTFAVLIVGLAAFGSRWIDATTLALSPHEKSRRLSGSFSTEELLPTSPKPPRDFELQNALRDLPSAIIVPPGVCALSSTGKVIFANHRFLELIQSAEGDLTGKSLFDCSMDNEIRASLQEYVKKSAEHGKISAEFKVNQLPERLRYFSVVIEPHHDEEQSPGRLLTVQEITDRRTIEFHLLEAQKMKNLGSVMGSIAHSFNNSLTAIIGRASFALRTRDQESQRIALEEIRGQAQKAGELVWKLLDFSEGKPTPFRSLSVGKLIHEKVEFLQKLLGERFQLKIAKEEESELWISGDSNLLMQVLTELISNAKDSYRDRGGNIELAVGSEEMGEDIAQLHPGARAGKYARITVRDTGCGMSSEMVSQAFAPLVSTKFNRGNSGLGLSIVYAILRAHDGFLSVESFPEKGTTVSVYLPLADPVAEVLETPPVEAMPAEKSTKQTQQKDASILVVEDEPEIRVLIGKMLEMLGYSVTTCGDAEAASTAFGEKAFDLLLVDYMMPSISGRDLIQDLKGKGSGKTKYILMSGFGLSNSDPNDPINHLPKPFDIETLDQAVTKALTN